MDGVVFIILTWYSKSVIFYFYIHLFFDLAKSEAFPGLKTLWVQGQRSTEDEWLFGSWSPFSDHPSGNLYDFSKSC